MRRRLAERLMRHAAAVMPEERREWAAAMAAEMAALPDEGEALAWALGCVWASYLERIDPMDVFVKSLLRAAAVWLVLLAFQTVLVVVHPHSVQLWRWGRIFAELFGGIFATLWVCELLMARFWTAPDKIFKKTLVRAAALWLWPLGLSIFQFVCVVNDPLVVGRMGDEFGAWLHFWLINWVTHYPVIFVAIFLPLLLCEWLIARHGRARQKVA